MPSKVGFLLIHGLTGVPSEMRPVQKYLQKMGFEVEAPTLAGHDSTNEALLNSTWQQWIDSARQGLNNLLQRCDEVILCGLSLGGLIAGILAAENADDSRIRGLVSMSPTLAYDSPELERPHLKLLKLQVLRDFIHLLVTLVPKLGHLIYWTERPPYGLRDERLRRQITKAIETAKAGGDTKFGLFRTYFISMWHMNHITATFRDKAQGVRCPALIVSSLEDTLVSINNCTNAYSLVGSNNKSLVLLTGCDHVLTLDLKRDFVCRLIGEFVEALTGVPAIPVNKMQMDLTVEVHNMLNPLSSADWAQLVPGAPSLSGFAEDLRKGNMHESHCHTVVVRDNNEPVLMVPLVIDTARRTALIGVEQKYWGTAPAKGTTQNLDSVWKAADEVSQALFSSLLVRTTSYTQASTPAVSATAH